MAGHRHHHDLEGAALRAAAQTALDMHGEQWTAMRAAIYDALAAQKRPTSAYDIADSVSQARGKRVAPNSVYRILDLFVASNLATRVESANAYIVNAHPGCQHDCIFLVCTSCGVALHTDDDTLTSALRERAARENFAPERVVIEVQGRCGDCATAS
ncbi:MAG: transcriptional repressor [Sphingobium sp.]|jgi:Fur family zinc uptake transcriptional regulator|nr:transcriptional repressor [Sphingobium sp.]MCI1271226.1 transcriptional repressor [Sphingobium sp.]MCI1755456.1 transcriptional repressor [Sphingobium sp.]MCI2052173.1 transcriptional repressor [Sphingobium sp.]